MKYSFYDIPHVSFVTLYFREAENTNCCYCIQASSKFIEELNKETFIEESIVTEAHSSSAD
jgi:biotin synthase-like enzyme